MLAGMSSETFSAIAPARRRHIRRPRPVTEKSIPFTPGRPQHAAPRPEAPVETRRRSASRDRQRRRRQRSKPPRVSRRLKPGGLYRWIRRFRIPVAITLALAAAAAVLLAAEAPELETTQAVRVTTDIGVGERLEAEHLEIADIDSSAVPEGHSGQLEDFLGQTTATTLPAGAIAHPAQLVGPGLLAGFDPGTVAVPVRPADTAIIGMLTPGQRVDVTASADIPEEDTGPRRIAESVPVLWVPQEESENWLGAGTEAQNVVILAVDAQTAEAIAEATHSGRLHLSLVGEKD